MKDIPPKCVLFNGFACSVVSAERKKILHTNSCYMATYYLLTY